MIDNFSDFINETKKDGKISDNELNQFDELLMSVSNEIETIIEDQYSDAYKLGGDARGAGYISELKKMMIDKIKKYKK